MRKQIHIVTPTPISLLDMTSMGDSSKRGNDKTLGQFDSGLKYAIALLLRNDVGLEVSVKGEPRFHENWEEPSIETHTFSTYTEISSTGKEKELIKIDTVIGYRGGDPMNQFDMREPSLPDTYETKTGFAKALGYNWELWMALRELISNMYDENGYYTENYFDLEDLGDGTLMTLTFDETNPFFEVWQNRHLYINEAEPLFDIGNGVQVLDNPEGYLRIYKQNILVYEDREKRSVYAYNISFGAIDERRILSNLYSIEGEIVNAIMYTQNREFLKTIIRREFDCEKEFLSGKTCYIAASNVIHDIAFEVWSANGQVESYDWLINAVKKRKDCKIGGKIITTVEDSIWSYSTKVEVESTPQTIAEPASMIYFQEDEEEVEYESLFAAEIKKYYDFNLDIEVKQAKLKGSKVVADKYEKCLIISEDFNIETDFHTFIVEYVDLTMSGNTVGNLGKYICKLLSK